MRSWLPSRERGLAVAIALLFSIPTQPARSQQGQGGPSAGPPGAASAAVGDGESAPAPIEDRIRFLARRIEDILAARSAQLPGARIGIAVADLDSDRMVYLRDADGLYNTASNTKLITASAALALLGPNFRYYTALYGSEPDRKGVVKGDLYIRGRGDPTLGTADLYQLVRELRQNGVNEIKGGIVVDSDYFDSRDLPPHFEEKPDDASPYRAPIGATSLNFNAVNVSLRPRPSGKGLCQVAVDPPNDYVEIDSRVRTVKKGRSRIRLEIEATSDNMRFVFRGQLRHDDGVKVYRRRVADPVRYMGAALRTAVERSGIELGDREITMGEVPRNATALAWRVSEPLAVLVRGLGKYSNNYMAEMILKTIGAERRTDKSRPATWEDALRIVRGWLIESMGWAPGGFYYGNGSGLFTSNRFSARQIVRLLSLGYRDFRWGPDLVGSLSIGGVDGTISRRMSNGPAAGRVRAKTGTLNGVSTLSGYVATDGREPLAFAILVNGITDENADFARLLQNDVCEAMIPFLEAGQ
jgi:serine-type D-Ala-D-Ala carboxypeptidase/endopeptidase (penicillin-binding protein 4)